MITLRIFRATSLVLFCFYSCIGISQGVAASTTFVENHGYSPESNRQININELKAIHVPVKPSKAEEAMARMLQKKMESFYKIALKLKAGLPDKEEAVILVGRDLALSSSIITEKELNVVKYDGYIIRGSGNRIAIAGHGSQGTIYGAYAFLRQIGLKFYPWHYSPDDSIEVFTPLEKGMLKPFSISSKPFFEHRDMLDHLDRGRFGGTIRQYSLGDLRFAQEHEYFNNNGYLGWDHTAGYLVPLQLYRDAHPEYFAVDEKGARLPKSTATMRVNICTCNPEVTGISAQRALEWMNMQSDRRYFAITDGDAERRCPQCELSDPLPDYHTDRMLSWTNFVARAVGKEHPEKILLANAYQKTAKPPVNSRLEPNVLIMYAPWYWSSRTTSAVGFEHPLNIKAMEEFMSWSMLFPGQMGVYDYPADWTHGAAERIKFYARNRVRWLYFNAPEGNLLHWVGSQLLWDPSFDAEDLESEFVEAFYGPAADTMKRFLRLLKTTIENESRYSNKFISKPESLRQMRSLLYQAAAIAGNAELAEQTRILEGVTEGLYTILMSTHASHNAYSDAMKDLERYMQFNRRILENCERLRFNEGLLKKRRKVFDRNLSTLQKNLPGETRARAIAGTTVALDFNSADELRKWRYDGSQSDLITPPVMAIPDKPAREARRGVKIRAPLSRLPVLPRGNVTIHAGRFHAERLFNTPLDADKHFFLDIHLHASRDVPVTIYVNMDGKLRSDVNLHAGEQIVRIDLRNHAAGLFGGKKQGGRINSIGFEIRPQDNFYPYPETQDTELVLFGMEAKSRDPEPARLPHKGRAIWMTQFRANIPHGDDAVRDVQSNYRQLMMRQKKYKSLWRDDMSRWKNENFRSFTEHRIVSPIYAILTGEGSTPAEDRAARIMQMYLMKAYGVELPINPPGLSPDPHTGNAIIIGRQPGLAAKRIHQAELGHVGAEGFVINARDGRIVISGNGENGTSYGTVRFLEDLGLRFLIPGIRENIPSMSNDFLHELYLLDSPYFRSRTVPCGDLLMTQRPRHAWKNLSQVSAEDIITAEQTASAIKDSVRRGKNEFPKNVESDAARSPLSCYVAAKLLWNPFTDTTRLIREFRE